MSHFRFTVVGHHGFVGGHLLRSLAHAGEAVQALDLRSTQPSGNLGHVIYCIGLTADFRTRPLDTVEAHVGVLRDLLAHGSFDSFTYLSSTRVYLHANGTSEDKAITVDPTHLDDLYTLSKLMGEALCLQAVAGRAKIVRLSNVAGPRADRDAFLNDVIATAVDAGHVEFRTSWSSGRDMIAIDDVVAMLPRIATSSFAGIVNLASGEIVTNQLVAELLSEYLGCTASVAQDAAAVIAQPIDTSCLQRHFGFVPTAFEQYFPTLINRTA